MYTKFVIVLALVLSFNSLKISHDVKETSSYSKANHEKADELSHEQYASYGDLSGASSNRDLSGASTYGGAITYGDLSGASTNGGGSTYGDLSGGSTYGGASTYGDLSGTTTYGGASTYGDLSGASSNEEDADDDDYFVDSSLDNAPMWT
jgi:hypothetical protein